MIIYIYFSDWFQPGDEMRRVKLKMADRGPCIFIRKHLAWTFLSFLIFLVSQLKNETTNLSKAHRDCRLNL